MKGHKPNHPEEDYMIRTEAVNAIRTNMTEARAKLIEASQAAHVVHGDEDTSDQFLQATYELRVIADDLAHRQSLPGTRRADAPIIARIQENLNETCDSLAIAAAQCPALEEDALLQLQERSENFLRCAQEILTGIDQARRQQTKNARAAS